MKKPLILIAGPTASGKTQSSVLLAQKINGEIISADSMQIYKKMDIGTAKVKPDEMAGIKHYMIDEWEADNPCSVAVFKERVETYLNEIYAKGKIPIIVGGTGFYINAILFDTQFDKVETDNSYRHDLLERVERIGTEGLHKELSIIDPVAAQAIHPHNIKRVIRALEYYHETGKLISRHNEKEKEKRYERQSPYDYKFFVLSMDRSILYHRINERIDTMMDEGLLEEVKYFYDLGVSEDLPSMKAIGYKEFFPYFKGEMSLTACVEQLKQNTRRYAKRQITWFKHQAEPIWIEVDTLNFDTKKIVNNMLKIIEE